MSSRTACRPPAPPAARREFELSPRERILAHFESRFFEVYGLVHEWRGTGAYWRAGEAGRSHTFPHEAECFNVVALDDICDLAEGDADEAIARIDVLFASPVFRSLGCVLWHVRLYWDELESADALSAKLAQLGGSRKRGARKERAA